MAEVLGVVASGISIATLVAQIANSVTKLKSYWDELQEAPEDIRLLIEEIEDLYLLLYHIEDDQRRNPMSSKFLDNASASRCLEHCKRGADSLRKLTDDLGSDINAPDRFKRKWASAKVVFKKDKIEKYKARLERAIRLLTLSHQCYTRALLQLQPDIIVSRISHTMHATQNNSNAFSSSSTTAPNELLVPACQSQTEIYGSQHVHVLSSANQHTTQISKRRVKRREELIARYRVPVWVMKWAWDVEFFRSRSGWTVRLNPTNLVSKYSPVCKAIMGNDLTRVQELFDRGQAFISDRLENRTLLHIAVAFHAFPICQFLLEHGADPNDAFNTHTPLSILAEECYRSDMRASIDMVDLMVNAYDAEFEISTLQHFRGPNEAFRLLQQHTEVPYYETHLELRVEVAMGLAGNVPETSSDIFRLAFAMHPRPIPIAAIHYKAFDGNTILHAIACAVSQTLGTQYRRRGSQNYMDDLPGWRALLRELVTNGADLHAVSTRLLSETTWWYFGLKESKIPDQLLKVWLEDLDACGVDLLEYGRKERALYDEMPMLRDFEIFFFEDDYWYVFKWRLIGFTYGSSPSDWHLWKSERTDDSAGDFWSLVEPPEMFVPGMWID